MNPRIGSKAIVTYPISSKLQIEAVDLLFVIGSVI